MNQATVAGPVDLSTAGILPARKLSALPPSWTSLGRAFVRIARLYPTRTALIDKQGKSPDSDEPQTQKLTYEETLLRATALARVLSRKVGKSKYVGIMVPPSVAAALANIAVTLMGKVAVNLNYSANTDTVNSAVKRCEITHVITSEKVLAKSGIKPDAAIILMDNLKDEVTGIDKAWASMVAKVIPEGLLGMFLPGVNAKPEDTATVMFTSGSTGEAKGVVLTHSNILSNIQQISDHGNLREDGPTIDVLVGKLPFFHSLGYTVTLWCIMCLGQCVVLHPNPMESKLIGPLMQEFGATIMASTPTLMRFFLSRCTPEQFATVRWLLLGSEKLKPELCSDIQKKLCKEPVEGFGCTQLSPVVAANVPSDVKTPDGRTVYGNKLGSVGQPVPGTTIAILDMESGAVIPYGSKDGKGKYRQGVIWACGPQVMKEYLKNPTETEAVLKGGWFNTEDVGYIDEDGFLWITDRLSRFAKIGGEMVPLVNVETAIKQVTGVNELAVSVTMLPDAKRGEKVVVVYTELGATPAEVCQRLKASGMTLLWIPDERDFVKVDAMPVGTTGKLDLKEVKRIAREKLGS
jgi:acyl-[acyl-carrier-protein]-phospholipid O-acyltransferase/long-chain-fatty-acid--[acyl-carrier-protein] ligase